MESSDPANKYVQHILNDEILAKEFDLDKRKFSRNYEGSFFVEKLNTGAKVSFFLSPMHLAKVQYRYYCSGMGGFGVGGINFVEQTC